MVVGLVEGPAELLGATATVTTLQSADGEHDHGSFFVDHRSPS